jgi:RNA recognition motif-containing protein
MRWVNPFASRDQDLQKVVLPFLLQDLEVIFSRFGTIVKCEVIKDRRTAASLQYAFVEFEQPEQCEQAFLKMDNVLIDDRRIHVDFSQSVSKNFQWNPKTGGWELGMLGG